MPSYATCSQPLQNGYSVLNSEIQVSFFSLGLMAPYTASYIYRYVVIIMASYCSLKFLTYFFFFDIS